MVSTECQTDDDDDDDNNDAHNKHLKYSRRLFHQMDRVIEEGVKNRKVTLFVIY